MNDNYQSQFRSIEMMQDRYNHLSSQLDKLKNQMDQKVCLEDFFKYTSKIASEYATLQMLDLSIQSIETRMRFCSSDNQMKGSLVASRVKQQSKQTQVYEYQHTIEQQLEERLNRFRELITSQVRQFCDQVQAQDVSKPFREQIQNNVNNLHEKLHQVELFQMEIQRHLEAREFEKLIKKYTDVEERLNVLENHSKGLTNLIQVLNQQKKIDEQEQKKKVKEKKIEDHLNQYLTIQDFHKHQQYIKEHYLTSVQGAQFLQRINESEDNIKNLFNKDIYDKLSLEIADLDEKFGIVVESLQNKINVQIQNQATKLNTFEMSINSFMSKSEVIQMLDNPQAMMKVNSAVQNIQEKFKELYAKQIDILESSFKFTISNIQAANITENDKLNQNALLLKKCEQIKVALFEYFGQNNQHNYSQKKKQELNYQQSQQFKNSNRLESKYQNRPLSVGSRITKIRRQSATPKVISASFSGSSAEPQFFQKVLQNPLVQKMKK
ncbi:unnamed protein product (macronuclear) [Paramecium tetraurelia]|uniref:Uncharacterized protein n=1 Tax=Paramecium tetraurelia TaxID=5888 RepID=A0DPD7_PARTE|nr:uncharacterized protein GSPATT00019086001 [Paramecium tetraurelia]CAK84904.1 unnamed protein product [Paramecium tetraurelia]|eukprot:XP_001452301.1 hypothetical protein (macronuclear) [Paramecium tetraurelia strain d4-2]